MKKFLLLFTLIVGLCIAANPQPAFAQACSVSSTFTSAGTGSTACFTKAGNQVQVTISNTFVGTWQLQYSTDNGASYRIQDTGTGTSGFPTPKMTADVLWRLFPSAYTSGTITYTLLDLSQKLGRIRYPNVDIGSVAYGSLGTSTACSATAEPVTDIYVGANGITFTGLGALLGATGGTDPVIFILRDSTGTLVATTTTAGTTAGTANTFQEIAFTSPVTLPAGRYYPSIQCNGTTATFRLIAASTYVNATGSFLTSVYGTIPRVLAMPTTFTATKAPFIYLYQ